MTQCEFCQEPADALKTEIERTWDDITGSEVETPRQYPICLACERYHFDGTEDVPGTQPL